MSSKLTCAARCTLVVVLTGAAFPVHAQIASSTSGALEEIVVTAQKREQNSQDIGISLSAISGADLHSLGAVTATDITKNMPAVVLTQPNGPSSFSLAIRGVTQNDFADHQESPAAIYVDRVYVSQMAGLYSTCIASKYCAATRVRCSVAMRRAALRISSPGSQPTRTAAMWTWPSASVISCVSKAP